MHAEVLTKKGAELFSLLSQFEKFYLAGGTALALHIGHRISVDFDLFLEPDEELPAQLLMGTKRVFKDAETSVVYRSAEQLDMLVHGVKVTFLRYPYPVIDSFGKFNDVRLASIREIAAMKAFSIGKRLEYKDYVDWYFMLKGGHVTLEDVILFSEKKFGSDFNARLFLGQLVSLDDISEQKINFIGEGVDRAVIEKFLTERVRAVGP